QRSRPTMFIAGPNRLFRAHWPQMTRRGRLCKRGKCDGRRNIEGSDEHKLNFGSLEDKHDRFQSLLEQQAALSKLAKG
ncbi:hypothetical protein, partial [Paraburkholderia solisilvae]|uniref:hypothetical protein n=1 Tax=Paraburkholderia solisilvae TaxID=624376 RepID=UPI0035EF0AAE